MSIEDNFRWLEDWNDAEVKNWSDAQNKHAREILDRLPSVDAIRERVTEIMSAKTVAYSALSFRRGMLFAIKREPPRQQPFLIIFPSVDALGRFRIVVDPNTIDKTGATTIDWYVPSPDGKLLAVSMSRAGTEAGDVHIFDTASGTQVFEVIPRVNTGTAGGDLAWLADASGFFYTRHPRKGERDDADLDFFQQVYFHKLGTPTADDRYEIGKDFPRTAEIQFEMHEASGRLLTAVQLGDGGEFAHYLRSPDGAWRQFADFPDRIIQATFGVSNDLLLTSRAGAPRGKIARVPVADPKLDQAQTVIEEGEETIVTAFYHAPPSVLATKSRLYVLYQLGGPTELRVFDHAGKRLANPEQLMLATTGGLTKLADDDVMFSNSSWVEPAAYYRFQAATGKTTKTMLASDSPVNFRDVEVIREFAVSKDGTKVPVNILMPQGAKMDGSNPTLVTGYGGYGISLTPSYSASRRVLLEQGVICVVANLRGGGEYGEPWHAQGNLTHKQNVFDDFHAVLKHLVERRYTSPEKLAIEGGSNGGLLMGAALTQFPEMVRTVVSHVGIYDMLRVEISANGVFNIAEFGSVKNTEQFHALYAYSPYHHVEPGKRYPSILFLTGANDPRVDPMQSRKMTARLQEVMPSDVPVLLRTSSNSGHGAGTGLSERIEQAVDVDAFLFQQLGVEYRPVGKR